MAQTVIFALLPVFLVVVLGYVFRKAAFFPEDFWAQTGRLTYYVLLPTLFFKSIALAPLGEISILPAVGAVMLSILLLSAMLLLLRKKITPSRPAFASVFQGGIRFNNYIGTSVASLLFAKQGVVYAAIFTALMVPLVNFLAVLILALYGSKHEGMHWRDTARHIALNPLILSCVAGVMVNLLGIPLPFFVVDVMDILSKGALPLGLMAVGAGMLDERLHMNRRIACGLASKLLALPLMTYGFCLWFGIGGIAAQVAMMMASLPGATSSYVLARQLGGDGPLAARLLSLQTLCAMATMPLMLALAMRL